MKRLMPYLGVLGAFFASGCVMETETEMEDRTAPAAYDDVGTLPSDGPGAPEQCAHDLVLGENGEPIQVPVLCDPNAERLPDWGEEEAIDPYLEHYVETEQY